MRVTFLIRTLYLLLLLGASTALAYPSSSQREARDSKPLDDSAVQSSDGVPRVPDTKSLIEAGMIYAAGSLGLMGSVVWLHQKSWELKDCLDPVSSAATIHWACSYLLPICTTPPSHTHLIPSTSPRYLLFFLK